MTNTIRAMVVFALFILAIPAEAKLHVFACEPEWAALIRELGGGQVDIFTATTASHDVHRIQPRPSLIARMRRADLAVCTGAELEVAWLPMLLRQAGNGRIQPGQPGLFMAADHVELLDIPANVDRSMGDVHPHGNPHVQGDPRRIAVIARALAARLAEIDAANADDYREWHRDFDARWTAALDDWARRAKPLQGIPVVVDHRAWSYLFDWLGLREAAAIEPKPGLPPSAGYLADLKSKLSAQPARIIIRAAYRDPRPAQWLNKQTGIPVIELPFTVGGSGEANDLFGLFEVTVARLLEGLK